MRSEIRNLRAKDTYRVIARALSVAGERFGLRVVHHSVQSTHIHLIVEAEDARALGRGMQGLSIRIARGLNAIARRRGRVLSDRYHARPLRTPREVRNALLYVLNNARKHGAQVGVSYGPTWLDPFSSACRFDGWARGVGEVERLEAEAPPWAAPSTWLLRTAWRRYGSLPVAAVPSAKGLLGRQSGRDHGARPT